MRTLTLATLVAGLATAMPFAAVAANPQVEIKTSMGPIVCILYEKESPITVRNFVALSRGEEDYIDASFDDERPVSSSLPRRIRPLEGRSSVPMQWSSVLLPAPDAPTMARI